jgi:hypothetical protein
MKTITNRRMSSERARTAEAREELASEMAPATDVAAAVIDLGDDDIDHEGDGANIALPAGPPPAPSWVPFSPTGRDQLATVKPQAGGEVYLAFRGRDLPTFTAAATISRIEADAVAAARQMAEVKRYLAAAAAGKLSRAARAARANLAAAEAQLNVLLTEDMGEDLPRRKMLAEKEVARRKAEVAEAEELEKSAASIAKARWQAAYDALGREHNTAAIRASQEAVARVNELARIIAEKCKEELLEMLACQSCWDGLGVVVSTPRRPSHAGLLMRLKDEALGAPWVNPEAKEPATAAG